MEHQGTAEHCRGARAQQSPVQRSPATDPSLYSMLTRARVCSVLPVEGPAPVAQHDGLATEACTDACGSQGAGELVEGNDAPAADGLAAPHYRSPLLEETLRQALPMVHKGRPMPIVSAKSWVVLDATSKGVVWGSQHNEPRTIASLTKIVTASVVVGLSKQKPSILNEIVEVSNVVSQLRQSCPWDRA